MLAQNQSCLDGFAEAEFIRQHHAFRDRIPQGKSGGVNLVRIQVHAGVEQSHRQPVPAIRTMLAS